MNFEQIIYDKNGPVLTVTLNRPDKLNAYTGQMQAEIISALDAADADDEIRAIIFTGAGRGFCAGADLSGGGNTFNNDAPGREGGLRRDGGGVLTLRIFESLKPIISACNGPAVGVGATLQCATDVRLASEEARYGFVFSKRAVVPEACSSWFLPRIVGIQQALEWTFSGRVFGAGEAGADNTASALIETIQPDIYFKGGDYTLDQIPEAAAVKASGGQISIINVEEGHSTSASVKKIQDTAA